MHIPLLSLLGTAAKAAWNKLRGRPTVQADRGAIAAGETQTIGAPVATGGGIVATEQATVITGPSGGPTIVVQPGATVNFTFYVDGLPSAPPPTRAHFLEGRRLQEVHHHEEAIGEFQAAFGNGDTEGQRGALHLLIGASQAIRGRLPQAERSLREAGKLFRSVRDKQGEGAALRNLGLVYLKAAEFQQAEECLTQSLAIQREVGDRLSEADALDKLGLVHLLRGLAAGKRTPASAGSAVSTSDAQETELETAIECFGQAIEISREIGDRLGEAGALCSLGMVHLCLQRWDDGKRYLDQALSMAEELGATGDRWEIARGVAQQLEGQPQEGGEEDQSRG